MSKFNDYQEWREAITTLGGFTLDQEYCEQRINALKDDTDKGTQSFIEVFGEEYREQVINWFQQALTEA